MAPLLYKWFLMAWLFSATGQKTIPASFSYHPIYVSVTEIEHNAKDKTLEISCKIFTDDFEQVLRRQYKTKIDLLDPAYKKAMNELVSAYVKKHLQLSVNGKHVDLQFIGFEQQEEGITSFYQVNNIESVSKIKVMDDILYEYKEQQMGIIHVTVKGNRKSSKLNNPDAFAVFEF
jgi:hypothetical protein